MPNVVTLDATVVDANGVVVPRDIDNTDLDTVPRGYDFAEIDAYAFASRAVKSDWVVKVINDGDNPVDVTAGVSTGDDDGFQEYAEDGTAETAQTGTPPDNVVHITGTTVAAFLGAELVADPAPTTGTIAVVFGGRLYGGG
jgi:hypothetical protein